MDCTSKIRAREGRQIKANQEGISQRSSLSSNQRMVVSLHLDEALRRYSDQFQSNVHVLMAHNEIPNPQMQGWAMQDKAIRYAHRCCQWTTTVDVALTCNVQGGSRWSWSTGTCEAVDVQYVQVRVLVLAVTEDWVELPRASAPLPFQ